jgi:hypothetical protein
MGLEADVGSVWCRFRRFGGDDAVSIFFLVLFLEGKSETCLPVCLLLHCNVRHGVGDALAMRLLF